MSRGKNGNFKRGNRTLAWYLDNKLFDGTNQERENASSPSLNKRKNSFDSESSLNSNGRQPESEERKRRANKARGNRQRSQNSFTGQNDQNDLNAIGGPGLHSDPIPIGGANNDSLNNSPDQQSHVALQQQFLALSAQTAVQKENYCYYDPKSDGYFYEFCGSRGWRKRNPKLHGNPPMSVASKAEDSMVNCTPGTQTIEKKVYVPIPVPVFPNNHSKFFPQAGTSPNIKYYDPTSDGFYYEAASVDGWKKRTPLHQAMHGADSTNQRAKIEPSSLTSFPPLSRDLTSQELEELILSKVKNAPKTQVPFASVVSKGLKSNVRQPEPDYPSSSSTVSSSVSDDTTPPPPGKENQCQQLFAQTKEPLVGSFDEPYEFYWSDSEKPENTTNQASSVSSMDDCNNQLSAYFKEMCLRREAQQVRVQRPSSLRIQNPALNNLADKRLPRFNVDQFIADLPGNDNGFMNGISTMYAPFGTDSPRTPFNQCMFTKDSPMFTPGVPKDTNWNRFNAFRQDETLKASDDIERGLRDIEKIWQSG